MNLAKEKKVSVLITTYNRPEKLKRAISSVINQTYKNIELIIIDDAAQSDTIKIINDFKLHDSRIIHIRNDINIGANDGDIVHIRRFIYDLATGDYFIYLCDDDYWLSDNFIEDAIKLFSYRETTVTVIYGQLSVFISKLDKYEYKQGMPLFRLTDKTINDYLGEGYLSKNKALSYMQDLYSQPIYLKWCMSSEEFLSDFSKNPALRNIVAGGTVYSMRLFKKSKALKNKSGSKWQAGFELSISPAIYGDVIYIDKPMIVVEVDSINASFRRTQVDHLNDCISGAISSFSEALKDPNLKSRHLNLVECKKRTIANICATFLGNTSTILRDINLTDCTNENIKNFLTPIMFIKTVIKNKCFTKLTSTQWKLFLKVFKLYTIKKLM